MNSGGTNSWLVVSIQCVKSTIDQGAFMKEQVMDRRTRKTKEALLKALTTLLSQKKINKISVKEITDLADVNRGTFYLHYTDVFDMLEKIEADMFNDFNTKFETYIQGSVNRDRLLSFIHYVFNFVRANADLCKILTGPDGDYAFLEKFKNAILQSKTIDEYTGKVSEYEYEMRFTISGCIGVIQSWLEKGMPEPSEKMAEVTIKMISTENRPGPRPFMQPQSFK